MYPVRILGIAPYPGLARIMQQLAAQRPEVQLVTKIGNMSNWRNALDSVPASSYDVIISRGGTARILSRFVHVPVVEITTSVYDMLAPCAMHRDIPERLRLSATPMLPIAPRSSRKSCSTISSFVQSTTTRISARRSCVLSRTAVI